MPISCSSAAQSQHLASAGTGLGRGATEQAAGQRGDAIRVRAVDAVAVEKRSTVSCASVAVHGSAEQVVEHAQPQRAADRVDPLDAELGDRSAHDGQAAGEHRHALGL